MNLTIPATTVERQRRATTPTISSWVSANAGSGKTYVLARRIIALMLAGASPSAILALTFTKTAAAEMAIRVQDLLGEWALKSDDDLRQILSDLEGQRPDADHLRAARRLFAQALETPGGLKIQTIHAFAERILHQFPLEAHLPMRFEVLEDTTAAALLKSARESIFMRAEQGQDEALSAAYEVLTGIASDHGLDDIISQALKRAPLLRQVLDAKDQAKQNMASHLGLTMPVSTAPILDEIFDQSIISLAQFPGFVALLETGGTNDKKLARKISEFNRGAPQLGAYFDLFLTAVGGMPKRSKISSKISDDNPEIAEIFAAEAERLYALAAKLTCSQIYQKSVALLDVMDAIFTRYNQLKRTRAALDFDDLIFHLKNLLENADSAAWVHYKLDAGISHILVDEAQDTNPDQWQIIDRLAREFFTGDSANPANRTIFAVGDEKQSIYSFQGARPEIFDNRRRAYARQTERSKKGWAEIKLTLSFRSTKEILLAVDHIFEQLPARAGLTASNEKPTHEAARQSAPGLVEIWPLEESEPAPKLTEWPLHPPEIQTEEPVQKLANKIAKKIAHWCRSNQINPATGKAIRAGDILILLQSRGPLFHTIIRALKAHNVPLAGADRLQLGAHIAVRDLLVLAQALLTPNDDLALATLLRSPLIDLSEDQLFALCYQRSGTILAAMESQQHHDAAIATALEKINAWRRVLDFDRPFEFFSHILASQRGRKSFFARLGYEADEILAEFLNLALAYERSGPATLQGFIHHMSASETEIKREQGNVGDAARVMTVHGAKGLEASIVFIADAHRKPDSLRQTNLFEPNETTMDDAYSPSDGLFWLAGQKDHIAELSQTVARARQRQNDEYHRLLYVAMTRAQNQLYICGVKPKRGDAKKDCWHDLVWQGLASHAQEIDCGEGQKLLRFSLGLPPLDPARQTDITPQPKTARPDWLDQPAPPTRSLPDHISPSRLEEPLELFAKEPGQPSPVLAREQGIAIHALLQYLPRLAPDTWPQAATRFLAQQLPGLSAVLRQQLFSKARAVLEDENLKSLFGDNALAEISLTGNAIRQTAAGPKPVTISGQIDRLIIEPTRVRIIDFKSNAHPPATPEQVSKPYLVQLGLYRFLLRPLYPERPVSAALLWTSTGELMEMPEVLINSAVSDFTLV